MLNQFKLLFRSMLLAMIFASICRLIFFLLNPYFQQFSAMELANAFFYGLLYDFSATIYVHGIFILLHFSPVKLFYKKYFQVILFSLFMVSQSLILFFNLIDTGFFPISGRRSGIELFAMAKETNGLLAQYLADYWFLALGLLLLIWANYFFYHRIFKRALLDQTEIIKVNWLAAIGLRLILATVMVIGARGGFNLIPLTVIDAGRQTRAELVSMVINTPFNMIKSTQQNFLEEKNYFTSSTALLWFDPIKKEEVIVAPKVKRNIVILIVESLGKEYVGAYNKGKGYTPFLDSLYQHSEVFLHAYANGKKSIEGIPAILSAMPSWMQVPYLDCYYQGNQLNSIGYYLKKESYNTSFYHGGRNGTMSFDNYVALSKVGDYFGLNEYPNKDDFDGYWGIPDRPYLRYFVSELSKKSQPFFSTVFTLTSHHPYILPEGFEGKYPIGTLPIHKTVGYADDALRNFFAIAKNQSWYANTTFIITADHSAENQTAYYQSLQGKYELPLIIYRPDSPIKTEIETTVSHLDILGLAIKDMGYNKPFFSFGSYASNNKINVAMQFHDQYYQLIQWPYVYSFDGMRSLGLYKLTSDSLMEKNLLMDTNYATKIDSFENITKAMIQTYNNRIIQNKTFEP
jgi:phosphoglycerol transferase MdoB-like AlkP superfamily enzyme